MWRELARKKRHYNVQPLRTKKEIDTFLQILGVPVEGKRNQLLFLIGINNGLRTSDIVTLKVKDVKEDNPYIVEQKTGKVRQLYLKNMRPIIDSYIVGKKNSDWLFPSRQGGHIERNTVYVIFREAAKLMGRNDIGTHTMRKTFGYHYYQKTHDVATLMKIFNHSSESVTKRYIGIESDDIKKTMDSFHLGF